MSRKAKFMKELIKAVIILLILTSIFWLTNLDIYLESIFFNSQEGFFLKNNVFWKGLYDYGTYPGLIIFLISFAVLILSFIIPRVRKYRKIAAFLFLLLFIGSGFIVNFVFKEHWGRPRPREIIQFGGNHEYVKVWGMGDAGGNSSFPSGHASVAFYLLFPYFLYKDKNPAYAKLALLFGISYGLLSGLGRMIQGGHFASDVLWSGGFMYLTGLFLYYILKMDDTIYL